MTNDKPAAPCTHLDFAANVAVIRLQDTGRFTTEITVKCSGCGLPFRWLGVPAGSSPYTPMVSIDGLELRAPIEPEDTPQLMSHAKFEMPPMPTRDES